MSIHDKELASLYLVPIDHLGVLPNSLPSLDAVLEFEKCLDCVHHVKYGDDVVDPDPHFVDDSKVPDTHWWDIPEIAASAAALGAALASQYAYCN